jgi:hypothetical protein
MIPSTIKLLTPIFILSFIVIVLRENNHLKQGFKVTWNYDFLKLFVYLLLALGINSISYPYFKEKNIIIKENCLEEKYGIFVPTVTNYKEVQLPTDNYLIYKKGNNLMLSIYGSEASLENSHLIFYQNNDIYSSYIIKIFYLNGKSSMGDVDLLLDKYSKTFYSEILNFAVHSDKNCWQEKYSSLMFLTNYSIIKNSQILSISSSKNERNLLLTPPPPPSLNFELNFDTYSSNNIRFSHLHLSNLGYYIWNDTIIENQALHQKINALFKNKQFLFISYDDKISFSSLVNTLDYIKSLKENNKLVFEEKYNVNLEERCNTDPNYCDSVYNVNDIKVRVLANFYNMNKPSKTD